MKRVSAPSPATLNAPIRVSKWHFLKKDFPSRQSEENQSKAPQLVYKTLSLLAFIAATQTREAPEREALSLPNSGESTAEWHRLAFVRLHRNLLRGDWRRFFLRISGVPSIFLFLVSLVLLERIEKPRGAFELNLQAHDAPRHDLASARGGSECDLKLRDLEFPGLRAGKRVLQLLDRHVFSWFASGGRPRQSQERGGGCAAEWHGKQACWAASAKRNAGTRRP